jgi:hypothetical protein
VPGPTPFLPALAILVGFCPSAGGVVTAGDPQPRLPRDKLLVCRGPDGKPAPVKTVAGWAKRRAEVVRGMESVTGKLPGDEKRCAPCVANSRSRRER